MQDIIFSDTHIWFQHKSHIGKIAMLCTTFSYRSYKHYLTKSIQDLGG